jgi:hypothetical protein
MPKILGNSLRKNNKSCRIFYNESKKIGFAFFCFFYDLLRIFKVSAKVIYYLRRGFTGRSLELLFLSRIGPWFTKNTLELMKETQCSPWAWRAARLAGIGPLQWRVRLGKGWRRKRGSPAVDLWPQKGGGPPVAGRSVAPREAGRGAPCSGGLPVWEGARVALGGRGVYGG